MGSNFLAGDWDARGFAVEDWVTGRVTEKERFYHSAGFAGPSGRGRSPRIVSLTDIDARQRWEWRVMVEGFAPLAE
jgi:hypothetical protein